VFARRRGRTFLRDERKHRSQHRRFGCLPTCGAIHSTVECSASIDPSSENAPSEVGGPELRNSSLTPADAPRTHPVVSRRVKRARCRFDAEGAPSPRTRLRSSSFCLHVEKVKACARVLPVAGCCLLPALVSRPRTDESSGGSSARTFVLPSTSARTKEEAIGRRVLGICPFG